MVVLSMSLQPMRPTGFCAAPDQLPSIKKEVSNPFPFHTREGLACLEFAEGMGANGISQERLDQHICDFTNLRSHDNQNIGLNPRLYIIGDLFGDHDSCGVGVGPDAIGHY